MLATMAASQKPSLLCSWSLCRDQNSPPHSAHLHRWYSSFLGIEKFYHSHLLKISRPHLSATCSAEKLLNFSSYLPRSPAPISCRTLCVWLSLVLLSVLLSAVSGLGFLTANVSPRGTAASQAAGTPRMPRRTRRGSG